MHPEFIKPLKCNIPYQLAVCNYRVLPVKICRREHGENLIDKMWDAIREELTQNVFVFCVIVNMSSRLTHMWSGGWRKKREVG